MRKRVLVELLAAAALAAVVVVPSFAGIRLGPTTKVKILSIDGHNYSAWTLSSPTVSDREGYLTYDVTGKSPKVTFQEKKGPGAEWAFVGLKRFERDEDRGISAGELQKGYTMKLQATEGPFKGWYLCREKDGSFILVENRSDSSTLEMLEAITPYKTQGK
jgi:hypothetical protein